MKFNINKNVFVQLTDAGRKIHRESFYESFSEWDYKPNYIFPKEDEDGWSKWQMWKLMQEFGESMSNGCPMPFAPEIIIGARKPTIRQRAIEFAEDRNISVVEFLGVTKKWNVAHPRQEFWATLRPEYSFPQIGQEFGKDHSTIQSGVNAFNRRSAQ